MAVEDHPHRPADPQREQRRVDGEPRGVLLLAAEAAAGLRLDHDDVARVVEREGPLQRRVDVVGALERADHGHATVVAGHRDHRLGLEVELLLVADPVRALDDEVGLGEARLDVAPRDLVA